VGRVFDRLKKYALQRATTSLTIALQSPANSVERLDFDSKGFAKLTHYAFRYPAKFHPPVARALLTRYAPRGGRVLDPFCGSGSLLVEAAADGYVSVGSDIDPVAVFVSHAKTRRYNLSTLLRSCDRLLQALATHRRSHDEYYDRMHNDIAQDRARAVIAREKLPVPAIPNLTHWFRNYVSIDLGRIRRAIAELDVPRAHREFLLLCFASIIRNASNADPVPVSGLEVTVHMRRRDAAGRVVDPYALLDRAIDQALAGTAEFAGICPAHSRTTVLAADATKLSARMRGAYDAVITSPPYHNAVDYYRRHQLEMYWLGLVETHKQRLEMLPHYIGRPGGQRRHPFVRFGSVTAPGAAKWESRIRMHSPDRADNFKHYVVAMSRVFAQLARVLKPRAPVVFVVGHSRWQGSEIPTASLLREIAGPHFAPLEQLWYPVPDRQRYMTYSRHNGAHIDREYVVAMIRTNAR
jgi:16S rRNA G966 N2-methylase RsmD